MVRLITLYAEYTDPPWPIWEGRNLLDESALPISEALSQRIKAWYNAWGETSWTVPEWPMWKSPSGADPVRDADRSTAEWNAEGEAICDDLRRELGEDYTVTYEPYP